MICILDFGLATLDLVFAVLLKKKNAINQFKGYDIILPCCTVNASAMHMLNVE